LDTNNIVLFLLCIS